MGFRRILVAMVGTVQGLIGVLSVVSAYALYIDLFGFQEWLDVSTEFLSLYMLVLIAFGFFSIMSGLFLLTERESP
jgi:hypothetical protein